MNLDTLIRLSVESPEAIAFEDVIQLIDNTYKFTPTAFNNGDLTNTADENTGSCKLFAFAQLNNLSEQQTLACFGSYYRDDVMSNPAGDNHQNIRNFIEHGWPAITFDVFPLQEK